MKTMFTAGPLALALAALTLLPGCQSSAGTTPAPMAAPAPAPVAAPAPAPTPVHNMLADGSDACEAAVAASFQKARGHANDQLQFLAEQRTARAGGNGVISASGAGTYEKAGKPVQVTYTCSYNSRTNKVTSSRWH
jgi:hypothetical protein